IVSKNGNLLLNVPLTTEGELEPETVSMLTEMGRCLDIIGEAVFATRCWQVASEGDGIRFTRNKENTVLYVANLGWSNDELRVGILNSSRIDLKSLQNVSLLGHSGKLEYAQSAEGLTIKVPAKAPFSLPAYAFKLTFTGQIPMLRQDNK
ncbi:MAG: alpha-L-fucosidase, partial [Verrucomicrobia bacterium]|nr:alpha-L-fucosidase [Verrucomicrobiota bacterium]